MTSNSETSTKVRQWTVSDYRRMLDAGILAEDDQVELLNGQITLMSPQRPLHTTATKRAYDYLKPLLLGKADVRSQSPITLNSHSEPEPDIAVLTLLGLKARGFLHHEVFLEYAIAATFPDPIPSASCSPYALRLNNTKKRKVKRCCGEKLLPANSRLKEGLPPRGTL